jgi:hypothetical protein
MRVFFNIEERVEVHLTPAGLKVLQEAYPGQKSTTTTLSIRELLRIFGPTFRSERNPQLFENNDVILLIEYGGRA